LYKKNATETATNYCQRHAEINYPSQSIDSQRFSCSSISEMQKQWVSRQTTILYCFRGDCTDCNMTLTLVSPQTVKKAKWLQMQAADRLKSCLTPAICNTG
jgi:hypothetical protein